MTEPSPLPRILLMDTAALFPGLQGTLAAHGYEVIHTDPVEVIGLFAVAPPGLVMLVGPPDGPAADVLAYVRQLREQDTFIPVIVFLKEADVALRVRSLRAGADECLDVSIVDEELIAKIDALLRIKGIQDRMHLSRQQLQRMSTNDALTGLLNRRHFEGCVRVELRRAKRYHDPLSLLLLDLDGFRQVNEGHGEDVGSEVLRTIANMITEAVRDVDLAARLFADTFGLLLPNTHLSGALSVAERVRKNVASNTFEVLGTSISMTVSVGIAFFPNKDVKADDGLFRLAQEALLQARLQGPGRIGLFQGRHYVYQDVD